MFSQDPVVRRIHTCVLAGIPVCLWGPPGAGKTARVLSYAESYSKSCERWLLSRCEPIDLKPRIYHGDKVLVVDPPEISRLRDAAGGLLFLDELNRASRETEGAALDRIDSPPPGVSVLAACNPPTRGQAARSLESAAANRFCHLQAKVDARLWARAQLVGWQSVTGELPFVETDDAILTTCLQKTSALVAGWITRRPERLEAEPDNAVHAGMAWPSARTWEAAKRVLAYAMRLGLDADDQAALVAGCIGEGDAAEFMTFVVDAANIRDPEDILKNPTTFVPIKDRVDITIVALSGVAAALARNFTQERWESSWQIAGICTAQNQVDAGMVFVTMAMANFTDLGVAKVRDLKIANPAVMMHKYAPRIAKLLVPAKK